MTADLFHQTSRQNAENILLTRRMYHGVNGLVGGGIYFTDNPTDTNHKATNWGAILKCRVHIGRQLVVRAPYGSWSYQKLRERGYDSILITDRSGLEYVVFNTKQVESCILFKKFAEALYRYGSPSMTFFNK